MVNNKKLGKTELLHIQLSPAIKKLLRKEAKERGMGMSNLICDLLYNRYKAEASNETPHI